MSNTKANSIIVSQATISIRHYVTQGGRVQQNINIPSHFVDHFGAGCFVDISQPSIIRLDGVRYRVFYIAKSRPEKKGLKLGLHGNKGRIVRNNYRGGIPTGDYSAKLVGDTLWVILDEAIPSTQAANDVLPTNATAIAVASQEAVHMATKNSVVVIERPSAQANDNLVSQPGGQLLTEVVAGLGRPDFSRTRAINDNRADVALPQSQPHNASTILRYPGGKHRARKILARYLPSGLTEMVSPFFGGGSFEHYCGSLGIRVHGYDAFEPVVNFWQEAAVNPQAVADDARSLRPLCKEQLKELRSAYDGLTDPVRKAGAFYAMNKAAWCGLTFYGGFQPNRPTANDNAHVRLAAYHAPNISVRKADFKDSLSRHPEMFAYLDPPYFSVKPLYGKNGEMHRGFDHEGLAEILRNREGLWLLSYDDCPEIRKLYQGFHIETPHWVYRMGKPKDSREVLILSHALVEALKAENGGVLNGDVECGACEADANNAAASYFVSLPVDDEGFVMIGTPEWSAWVESQRINRLGVGPNQGPVARMLAA